MFMTEAMSENTIYIFFRMANFLVLIALFSYLFWRYGLTVIRQSMAEREMQEAEVHAKKNNLAVQERAIKKAIIEQDQFCQHLQQTTERWRKKFHAFVNEREQEKKKIKSQLAQKVAIQQKFFEADCNAKIVVPRALEQAAGQLEKRFSDEKEGRLFVGDLVAYMKKNDKSSDTSTI